MNPRVDELTESGAALLQRSFRHYWHAVAYASDVGAAPVKVVLLGEHIVLVRLAGAVRAFRDMCIHRGTPLSLGEVDGDELRCAYHGWTYDCDGVCTAIPSVERIRIPARARLHRYPVVERGGMVWVSLVDEPLLPVPDFPWFGDPEFRVLTVPAYDWACSAPRRMENVLDLAHFAWLHDGLLGRRDAPLVPEHEVRRDGAEIRVRVTMTETSGTDKNARLGIDGDVQTEKRYRVFMPFTAINQQVFPNGRNYVLFWAFCPIGLKLTRTFTMIARNYGLGEDGDREVVRFNATVIAQDRPIVEGQRPEELPFDITDELHVKRADRVSVEYRQWLYELADRVAAAEGGG